jgi:hypothetical protein
MIIDGADDGRGGVGDDSVGRGLLTPHTILKIAPGRIALVVTTDEPSLSSNKVFEPTRTAKPHPLWPVDAGATHTHSRGRSDLFSSNLVTPRVRV